MFFFFFLDCSYFSSPWIVVCYLSLCYNLWTPPLCYNLNFFFDCLNPTSLEYPFMCLFGLKTLDCILNYALLRARICEN